MSTQQHPRMKTPGFSHDRFAKVDETGRGTSLGAAEQEPLISGRSSDAAVPNSHKNHELWLSQLARYCLLIEFLTELSNNVLTVPLVSLLERAICENYYHEHDQIALSSLGSVDEALCKIPEIQGVLAKLRGWKAFFETLSAILLALPIGRIAEKVSHRRVYAVIVVGILAGLLWTILILTHRELPLQLVWGSSVFYLLGGGYYASEMMSSVMIAAGCSERDRTRTFFYAYSCFIATELIGPPLAAWTSEKSLWIPIGMGIASLLLCFPVLAIMPESQVNHANPCQDTDSDSERLSYSSTPSHRTSCKMEIGIPWYDSQMPSIFALFRQRNMLLALPIFLVGVFRGVSIRLLIQYTSVTFGWKLSQTNAIISEVASINLILFFFVLPGLVLILNCYFSLSPRVIDLGIVRCSLFILFGGSILIAFSPTTALLLVSVASYATGFGARASLLSLVTTWFPEQLRARLYSTIFLVEQLGMLVGEPLLQNVFASALKLSRFWHGLPFLCSGLCYLAVFLCSLFIHTQNNLHYTVIQHKG